MITSKQRAYLRGLANDLPAIMQIGKGGMNENMLKTFSDALEARELIKLHVLENSGYSPKEAIAALAEALGAEPVSAFCSLSMLVLKPLNIPPMLRG